MQFTNYALTVLLPALVAAQGGAESVGQEIGQGLGAVSFLPRPSQFLNISNNIDRPPALWVGLPQQ